MMRGSAAPIGRAGSACEAGFSMRDQSATTLSVKCLVSGGRDGGTSSGSTCGAGSSPSCRPGSVALGDHHRAAVAGGGRGPLRRRLRGTRLAPSAAMEAPRLWSPAWVRRRAGLVRDCGARRSSRSRDHPHRRPGAAIPVLAGREMLGRQLRRDVLVDLAPHRRRCCRRALDGLARPVTPAAHPRPVAKRRSGCLAIRRLPRCGASVRRSNRPHQRGQGAPASRAER